MGSGRDQLAAERARPSPEPVSRFEMADLELVDERQHFLQ